MVNLIDILKPVNKDMKKDKYGRLLFMETSYVLGCPPRNVTAYTMVKSSLLALMKSLAIEYAQFGITANAVAASMIETNFLKDTSHLIVEMSAEANPMKRNAKVDDIVPAMMFLLSEESRYITGVTLPITGGSTMI